MIKMIANTINEKPIIEHRIGIKTFNFFSSSGSIGSPPVALKL